MGSKFSWFAMVAVLCVALPANAQLPPGEESWPAPGDCNPGCVNPNTYCPPSATQCACVQGYVPFIPVDPPPLFPGYYSLECVPKCGPDQIRPPGERMCTYCPGSDKKPNADKTACLVKECRDVWNYSGFSQCDAGRKQRSPPPAPNGCSAPFDHHGALANFTEACNNHDTCYATCGADKGTCDRQFGSDAYRICKRKYSALNLLRYMCFGEAELFEESVKLFGRRFYEERQVSLCQCCNWVEEL